MESVSLVKFLIDIALKSAILIGFAGLTALAMHRQSASMRSLVWAFALAAVVILPVFTVLTPMWEVPLLPDIFTRPNVVSDFPDDALADGAAAAQAPASPDGDLGGADSLGGLAGLGLSWLGWATLAWTAGAVVFLGWFLTGKGVLWWICTRADSVEAGPWNALLRRICGELGISRPVRLFRSHHATVAFTSGIRHPALILPAAADTWTEESVRLVMLHELAHVKRWDTLTEVLAQVATILYWFHPLVWLAAHWFRVERERACDDMVLNSGSKPSEYATQLMEVARSLGLARRPLWQAAAISQGSSLKDRLMFILDPTQKRTPGHRLVSGVFAGLMIALILPLAAFTPWTPPGNDGVEKSLTADDQVGSPKKKMIWAPGEIPRHADLASKLFSADSEARWAAAQALGTIGDEPALKVLRSAIGSGDPDVQMTAMKELAAIGDPPTVEVFIKALEAEDPKVRSHAAIDLVTVLGSDNPKARQIALEFLASGEDRHLPAVYTKALEGSTDKARDWVARSLMKLLYDKPLDVRMGIMESLASANDPQFAEAFGLMLKKDPHPKIRHLAIKAIGSLPKIRQEDFNLLIETLLTDEHPGVRGMAALTLGMMGDARAMKPLEKALEDKDGKVRDSAKKGLTLLKHGRT